MSANDESSPGFCLTFEDICCWRDQEDEKVVEKLKCVGVRDYCVVRLKVASFD
jgi:hypothetical protein